MLYLIAGASLSGKSTIRQMLTKQTAISGIDTDTLRTIVNRLRPDLSVGHMETVLANYENMKVMIEAFIYARSFFDEDYILEGDAINLESIYPLIQSNSVRCVVMGYAADSVSDRLQLINQVDEHHWTKSLESKQLQHKIQEFIDFSGYLRGNAVKYGLSYIDATHERDISSIYNEVKKELGILEGY